MRYNRARMELTVEEFEKEIAIALRHYDKYVVCIEKTPDELQKSLQSLVAKAINAFAHRPAGLRHGIALDRHVTVILSETDGGPRPMCGIYFNLHSPYQTKTAPAAP